MHHVASMYPIEIEVAQVIAAGKPLTGVTMHTVHEINARHAVEFDAVTKEAALELLARNSAAAADAIRALSDEDLAAAPASLYADAPLTCQLVLEDHAVRHSYHHLADRDNQRGVSTRNVRVPADCPSRNASTL